MQIKCYQEAVVYLMEIPKFTKKNGITETRAFLEYLNCVRKDMKIIHVAGTNGKGSTCAYINGLLQASGYRCGFFTSPHLIDIRERFIINNEWISEQLFYHVFCLVFQKLALYQIKNPTYHPSFFEYLFFMAMCFFGQDVEIDYVILETGLGGRLDATNAIGNKEVAVITRLGLDHTEYLGNTIADIAFEKSGIIKAGKPVVFWQHSAQATDVIRQIAIEKGSLAISMSKNDYNFLGNDNKTIDFLYKSSYDEDITLRLPTVARYQIENCTLAIRVVEILLEKEHKLSKQSMMQAISKLQWSGRMENIQKNVWLDGAHNVDGIRAFLATVQEDECIGNRTLIFSVVQDKKYDDMVLMMMKSKLFDTIILTKMQNGRSIVKEQITSKTQAFKGLDFIWVDNSEEAFWLAISKQRDGDYIYIAGSLYLVGEIKSIIANI